MSLAPSRTQSRARSRAASLAPPNNNLQPMRGSSIFVPPNNPSQLGPPSRPGSRMEPPPLASTMGPMPGTLERPLDARKKRLILTCDGTWQDSDNGLLNGHKKQPPSNVARIGWAIKDTSRDGISQVVHYQAGVGTTGGALSKWVYGTLGVGLKENLREAYNYIAVNWREGDEIFLIGFSRGAFTARSVGGMMGDMGLLTRKGLPFFNEIFEDYEHRNDEGYMSDFPDTPFPDKGPFSAKYVAELERRGLTRLRVPIRAVCCWDTVGSLGIPKIPLLEGIGLQMRKESSRFQFYDTKLNPYIENAFQALALDEHRAPFSPALWEKRDSDRTNLKQVWFPGVHSNVGGGYDDQEIANITLAWMMSRLEPFLDFRPDFLIQAYEENKAYYKSTGQKARWWGFGEIYNSLKGLVRVTGRKERTPGGYHRVEPETGRAIEKRLKNTNEYIHASVRTRMGLEGPGTADQGVYDPLALRDWEYRVEQAPGGQGGNADGMMVVWTNNMAEETGSQKHIPEAILLETELTLLRQSARVEEFVRRDRGVGNGVDGDGEKKRRRRKRGGDPPEEMGNGSAVMGMSGGLSPRDTGTDMRRERSRPRSMMAGQDEDVEKKRRKRKSRRYS